MPPKKKAKTVKKPSPAYLAELEKLKRRKRKYEPTEFTMYHEDDDLGYWITPFVLSHLTKKLI